MVKKNGVVVETTRKKALRPGVTPEMMHAEEARHHNVSSAVAVNPPAKSPASRCAVGGDCASIPRGARQARRRRQCLPGAHPRWAPRDDRLPSSVPENASIATAAFGVLRGLLQNPSTMMKIRKQKRFRIIPATVVDAVHRHRTLDVKAEAAHVFWTYAGVGGSDANTRCSPPNFGPAQIGDGGGSRRRYGRLGRARS